jgi:DNA-binding NtrC family response regulator
MAVTLGTLEVARVLVVEDEVLLAWSIRKSLERANVHVTVAGSVQAGRMALKGEAPEGKRSALAPSVSWPES